MASRGGQLGGTRPARKGSWRLSTLQRRVVRGDQAYRGGQLGVSRLAQEQLGINQIGRGVIRGDQAGRQKQLGANRQSGRQVVGSQQSWIVSEMSDRDGA